MEASFAKEIIEDLSILHIQDYEQIYLKNPKIFPDFEKKTKSEKWQTFLSKTSDFRCSRAECSKSARS
jgi:hypothetical protein